MVEHWVNDIVWVSEREGLGDSVYRAWHCTDCIRHNGSKGWTLHQAKKYGLDHYESKHS